MVWHFNSFLGHLSLGHVVIVNTGCFSFYNTNTLMLLYFQSIYLKERLLYLLLSISIIIYAGTVCHNNYVHLQTCEQNAWDGDACILRGGGGNLTPVLTFPCFCGLHGPLQKIS